jgi:diketogulonate reductase-like aldo/keto reductase
MPALLYGTAWKKEGTAEAVRRALAAGFRGIDTACQPKHYDEPGAGAGIAAFLASAEGAGLTRGDLYVQTKFTPLGGQDPERVPYDAHAAPRLQVAQSVRASLANLRTDVIDCLVLHSPIGERGVMVEVWSAMEDAVDAGSVRRLGLSNCYSLASFEELHSEARVKPCVLQNRFYAQTGYDVALRAFCRGVGVTYQSFWTLTANEAVLGHASVAEIATRHGRSPAQVLFRYLSDQGVVPLTGTLSDQHMREDLAITEFSLDDGERAAITRVLGAQRPTRR